MAEPVETFVGWTAIGFGIMFVYSAISGKSLMKEILGPALTTGKIPSFGGLNGKVVGSLAKGGTVTDSLAKPKLDRNITTQAGVIANSGGTPGINVSGYM